MGLAMLVPPDDLFGYSRLRVYTVASDETRGSNRSQCGPSKKSHQRSVGRWDYISISGPQGMKTFKWLDGKTAKKAQKCKANEREHASGTAARAPPSFFYLAETSFTVKGPGEYKLKLYKDGGFIRRGDLIDTIKVTVKNPVLRFEVHPVAIHSEDRDIPGVDDGRGGYDRWRGDNAERCSWNAPSASTSCTGPEVISSTSAAWPAISAADPRGREDHCREMIPAPSSSSSGFSIISAILSMLSSSGFMQIAARLPFLPDCETTFSSCSTFSSVVSSLFSKPTRVTTGSRFSIALHLSAVPPDCLVVLRKGKLKLASKRIQHVYSLVHFSAPRVEGAFQVTIQGNSSRTSMLEEKWIQTDHGNAELDNFRLFVTKCSSVSEMGQSGAGRGVGGSGAGQMLMHQHAGFTGAPTNAFALYGEPAVMCGPGEQLLVTFSAPLGLTSDRIFFLRHSDRHRKGKDKVGDVLEPTDCVDLQTCAQGRQGVGVRVAVNAPTAEGFYSLIYGVRDSWPDAESMANGYIIGAIAHVAVSNQLRIAKNTRPRGGNLSSPVATGKHGQGNGKTMPPPPERKEVKPSAPPILVDGRGSTVSGGSAEQGEGREAASLSPSAPQLPIEAAFMGNSQECPPVSDALACKICMDQAIDTLLLPCRHAVMCGSCARTMRECPCCRAKIVKYDRIYMS